MEFWRVKQVGDSMKIGQFSETFIPIVDGVGRVVYSYAESLANMGNECYVITADADTGYRGKYPFEIVDYNGVNMVGANQYRTGIASLDMHYGRRIRKIELDILHAHSPFFTGHEALRLKRKRDLPLIATFHSKYYDDFLKVTKSDTIADIGVRGVVNFYEKCDEVWAVSKETAKVLNEYGYEKEIFVMENGVNIIKADDKWADKARDAFSLPKDKKILLYVGQINFKKNLKRVVEACSLLIKAENKYHVVFAGQGPDKKELAELIEELGVSNDFTFTGHITSEDLLYGLYMCSSLFLFPSLYDNAPMVLREAAMLGTPAVLAKGSSSAEVVTHGHNGFISGDNSRELADVIRQALSDEAKLLEIGKNASETIPISWDLIMKRVIKRYEYVIHNHKYNVF